MLYPLVAEKLGVESNRRSRVLKVVSEAVNDSPCECYPDCALYLLTCIQKPAAMNNYTSAIVRISQE